MAFNNFRETNETNELENKEASTENNEKRCNQILDVPEDYNDDFDEKMDANDAEENENTEENEEKSDGEEKKGLFARISDYFSSKEKNDDNESEQSEMLEKSDKEKFLDSIKVTQTPDEIKEYNEKNGYSNEVKERPKGGFERERTLYDDISRYYDEDTDNNNDVSNDNTEAN